MTADVSRPPSPSTQTSPETLSLVAFTADHISGAHRLSQAAGWPHRPQDWELLLGTSVGVVALSRGQVVGTALCSLFGDVAALNMIIVDEQMRGRGLGRRLMTEVIALAQSREMRLCATTDGLPLYQKLGFVKTGTVMQFQGIAKAGTPAHRIELGTAADIAKLAQMDHDSNGMDRHGLLMQIAQDARILLAQNGFALVRPFGRGYVVGPIVASDCTVALSLLAQAGTLCAGQFLRVDMAPNAAMEQQAVGLGLDYVGGGTTMVHSARPRPVSAFTTYAIAAQALG
ncbi:hypothetical protein BFP70_17940 [Thioclava sp. SK-1]|uniref:GNAT family N-acetyltransferase n=1 Tax=Thioclava sp. SK-1 TaxID=1889770 RepID=UPI000824DC58|nr:GNAT family N-acetyltransferase [Thioclava sp. SK-1]OCX59981.1 hypothetical protein BFP70_17940 [Thioclava sp. SK-1]